LALGGKKREEEGGRGGRVAYGIYDRGRRVKEKKKREREGKGKTPAWSMSQQFEEKREEGTEILIPLLHGECRRTKRGKEKGEREQNRASLSSRVEERKKRGVERLFFHHLLLHATLTSCGKGGRKEKGEEGKEARTV